MDYGIFMDSASVEIIDLGNREDVKPLKIEIVVLEGYMIFLLFLGSFIHKFVIEVWGIF